MKTIEVNPTAFRTLFPEFKSLDDTTIDLMTCGVGAYISTTPGAIGLDIKLQTRGVYLATAHIAYMAAHPDKFKMVASASEGSVSASFATPPNNNIRDYWLGLTPYGMELLYILSTIQPPIPRRPINIYPYYGALNG